MEQESEVIGEGAYGCVHKPSLKCLNNDPILDYTNTVSKLILDKDADEEIKEYGIFATHDLNQDFFLGVPIKCGVEATEQSIKNIQKCKQIFSKSKDEVIYLDNFSLLIQKDGGKNIKQFCDNLYYEMSNGNIKKGDQYITDFWNSVLHILNGLKFMNERGIIHHDLKPQNIVYNSDLKQMKFIDFGLMLTQDLAYAKILDNTYRYSVLHFSFPPQTLFFKSKNYKFIREVSDSELLIISQNLVLIKEQVLIPKVNDVSVVNKVITGGGEYEDNVRDFSDFFQKNPNDTTIELNLQNNNRQLDDDVFKKVEGYTKLSMLDSSFGNLINISIKYPEKLMYLNLHGNNITEIPDSILLLKQLIELDVSSNKIEKINERIGELTSLSKFIFSNNKIVSLTHKFAIPESFYNLINLKIIKGSFNKINGFSNSINKLKNLEHIDMSHNTFSILPDTIGKLSNLNYLDVSYNFIYKLPESIVLLSNLTELKLINEDKYPIEIPLALQLNSNLNIESHSQDEYLNQDGDDYELEELEEEEEDDEEEIEEDKELTHLYLRHDINNDVYKLKPWAKTLISQYLTNKELMKNMTDTQKHVYLHNRANYLVKKIYEWLRSQKESFGRMIENNIMKIDIYGMGLALKYALNQMHDLNLINDRFYISANNLFVSMLYPNMDEIPSIDEIINEYKRVIMKI